MAEAPQSLVALRNRREHTIELLCRHFALDHLEAEELERRIDRAHGATSLTALDDLLADLPAVETPAETGTATAPARGGEDRDHQVVVAVMGGAERRGAWAPARRTHVLAVMGGVCLDFRDASLRPGVTEIQVLAVMGGVEIVVPPGIHVESNGIGIMGGFEHSGRGRFPVDSSVPVLRVAGLAFMGGVEIVEKPPRLDEGGGSRKELPGEGHRRLDRGEPRDGSGWTGG